MEVKFDFGKERKLGDIVQDFINLLRLVLPHFARTMLRLAIFPLCAMLVLIYYGTTRINLKSNVQFAESVELLVLLFIGFVVLLIFTTVFFGLAIEYFLLLKTQKSIDFVATDVWRSFRQHAGKYLKFLVVALVAGLLLSIPLLLAMGILSFIPFIGSFAAGILASFVVTWFSCSFLFYREGYYRVTETIQQTFGLMKKKFIDYGVSSYVVGLVFQILLVMLTLVPSIIIGIIAYNTIGFSDAFLDGFAGRILVALGGTLLIVLYLVYYLVSVLVYGIIYETAKEMKYGEDVYDKINSLGRRER